MSVSVNYTSFTKTREGNETLPGSPRRPHARFLHCPRSAHVPGFLRGTRRGPGAGAVGGKRPRREETTRVGGRGGSEGQRATGSRRLQRTHQWLALWKNWIWRESSGGPCSLRCGAPGLEARRPHGSQSRRSSNTTQRASGAAGAGGRSLVPLSAFRAHC